MKVGIYKQRAIDVMTPQVETVHCKETVRDALILMTENRLAALPVVDGHNHCVGIISQSDLIEITRCADKEGDFEFRPSSEVFGGVPLDELTSERIEDVMTDRVVSVTTDAYVVHVADVMLNNNVHHVPVCDSTGKLCGIISTMDILSGLRTPLAA
jgi:CBS-domain-containing membrane protein